ncbi:MAG: serine/threonine protein kinase [Cyanobacteria bacterium SZAS LIN-3]|nr:serine/threonine protein kinase [Cyanobacteria bacterium SZAS LIN-3]MBS2010797.1 serine/threonine protein kinase [Cyanobacteria bacterium SZAS TMP-1]
MSGPDPKKPNLKPKADLAGWLDKLGSGDGEKAAPRADAPPVKLVVTAEEVEMTGTNVGGGEEDIDGAITGTDVGAGGDGSAGGEADIEPGYIIADQYEIVSLLGQGGMSAVYKATDLLMKRSVAVKCLHTRMLSDKTSILRFQKEAQAAGNLNHPHIVKIHQYGLDSNKRPFLVMDYLEGQSLQELIDGNKKLPLEEAARILVDAADGLEQAHKKGVVHRDFKPSNIMLVRTEEENDCVKLVDFGIAKLITPAGEEKQNLTQTGEMLGSPNYMSPEQCLMMELDSRSDIYAFGCTMFAAFTGRAPFSSNNIVEIYYKHMNDLPESIAVSRPDLKEAPQIDAVILKCMAKDPADRYQTIGEARAAIQAIVDGGKQNIVDSLKDQIELNRLKGKARKSKKLPVIAVSATVGLIAIVGMGAYYGGHLSKTPEQDWHDYYVKGQVSLDEGNYKQADEYLNKALSAARGTGKTLDFIIPTAEELLDLAVITNNRADIEKYQNEISQLQKQYENSFPELAKEIATAVDAVNSEAKTGKPSAMEIEHLCQTINDQSKQLISTGYYDRAIEILKSADLLATKALAPNAAVQARTLHNLATAYNLKGEVDVAYDYYKQAAAFIKKNLAPEDPSLIKALLGMANVDWHAKRYDAALAELREASKIVNISMGATSPIAAKVKVALAQFYSAQGLHKLALTELNQAWAIYERDPQADVDEKARCAAALAHAQNTLEGFRRALTLQELAANKEESTMSWILEQLGDHTLRNAAALSLSKEAASEKAAAYYKRALAIAYRLSPRDEQRISELLSRLSNYNLAKNDPLAMTNWYAEKIEFDQRAGGKDSAVLVDDYLGLANVYRQARKLDLCENALDQALAVAQKNVSGNNGAIQLFRAQAALAAARADGGKTAAAADLYAKALDVFAGLGPEERKQCGAPEFFARYQGLLMKLNRQDLLQQLKTNFGEYIGR